MRPTQPLNRRRGRRIAAAAIGFALVAAACSDKKDDEAVGGADDTTATEETEARGADTTAPATPHPRPRTRRRRRRATSRRRDTETTERRRPTEHVTLTRCRPGDGPGHTAAASSSPARPRSATPWTPAAMQCDSYCQMRIRTFFEPLFTFGDDLEVHGVPRREHQAQRGLHGVDDQAPRGHHVHDGTPLNADAVIDNLNRTPERPPHLRCAEGPGQGTPTARSVDREARRLHVHDRHRQERRPDPARPVAALPVLPRRPAGLHRLADVARPPSTADPDAGDPAGRHRTVHRSGATCPATA